MSKLSIPKAGAGAGARVSAMSDLGQQRTYRAEIAMSALPLKADIRRRNLDVSFGPIAELNWSAPLMVDNFRRQF
jgi:hypothetical protein